MYIQQSIVIIILFCTVKQSIRS